MEIAVVQQLQSTVQPAGVKIAVEIATEIVAVVSRGNKSAAAQQLQPVPAIVVELASVRGSGLLGACVPSQFRPKVVELLAPLRGPQIAPTWSLRFWF